MTSRRDELLRYAAKRAERESIFLASVLRVYQEIHQMDDEQLAKELGCQPTDLAPLRLCGRPDPAPERFRADIERIAEHFGIPALPLARIVREVDATLALRAGADEAASQLLAARDRTAESDADRPTTDDAADESTE